MNLNKQLISKIIRLPYKQQQKAMQKLPFLTKVLALSFSFLSSIFGTLFAFCINHLSFTTTEVVLLTVIILYQFLQCFLMQKKKQKDKQVKQPEQSNLQRQQSQKYTTYFRLKSQKEERSFLKRIKDYHGKNAPITYRPEYNFTQQWQSESGNLLETLGPVYVTYSFLTMFLYVVAIWTISIQRYFQTRDISLNSPIYQLLIILNISDIALRIYLKYKDSLRCLDWHQLFTLYYNNLFLISYFCLMLNFSFDSWMLYVTEVIVIYFLYRKAGEIYGYIKMMQFGLQYENYVKIIDLLLNIFIQAHIFALVLFVASKIDVEKNWIKTIGIEHEQYMVKYINAIYFASTTMLTIGYGDIAPQGLGEKLVVIVLQIVGVIAFGYLLNQMGHTLSKMREQSEVMERDLQTISKISKYYNLDPKVQNKARNFIFNNQRKNEDLKIEDENLLLNKFNESLRNQINLETSVNIVKSCIFYLCHWSKSMQLEIAHRLEKKIFAPNEKLASSNGIDRVYIIKKGHIDISMNRYASDQEQSKVLRKIKMGDRLKIEVSDNLYGYTAVFSNRPVKLEATAKDFTSTFSVSKEDILFCIAQSTQDFEYYHEIKCRIDQSAFCEEWEAPAIKNIRQHYCPSHILTIKKYKAKLKKQKNNRNGSFRERKAKFSLISNYVLSNSNANQEGVVDFCCEDTIVFEKKKRNKKTQKSEMRDFCLADFGMLNPLVENSVEYSVYQAGIRSHMNDRPLEESDNIKQISSSFESVKEYFNFFNKNNLTRVLYQLDKENPMEKSYGKAKND